MKTVGNAGTVASELMFVLCKRSGDFWNILEEIERISVARMIKYTGFGHSAGLLANAGLLGQVNMPKSSADSEDSETEEYAAVEDKYVPLFQIFKRAKDNSIQHRARSAQVYKSSPKHFTFSNNGNSFQSEPGDGLHSPAEYGESPGRNVRGTERIRGGQTTETAESNARFRLVHYQ